MNCFIIPLKYALIYQDIEKMIHCWPIKDVSVSTLLHTVCIPLSFVSLLDVIVFKFAENKC